MQARNALLKEQSMTATHDMRLERNMGVKNPPQAYVEWISEIFELQLICALSRSQLKIALTISKGSSALSLSVSRLLLSGQEVSPQRLAFSECL